MKKIVKGLMCTALCGVLALAAAGCKKDQGGDTVEHLDNESRVLRLAIGSLDQKFNPLFYTSQNDGEIAGMTQVSMLTAELDSDGKTPLLACGDDHPTVALDYQETYYDDKEMPIGGGDGRKLSGKQDKNGYTTYEFVIKNGMKFSDGVPLTVMDVLFNLYIYLDPSYSGSSTIYSTKICGMQSYRQQEIVPDDFVEDTSAYYNAAQNRIDNLIQWYKDGADSSQIGTKDNPVGKLGQDYYKMQELYLEELTTDWNSIATSWTESYKEYRFTETWQVYYFIEGLIRTQTDTVNGNVVELFEDLDGNGKKDDGEKYYTTLDAPQTGEAGAAPEHQALIDEMAEACTPEKIAQFKLSHADYTDEQAKEELQKKFAIEKIYNNYYENAEHVLTVCATRGTLLQYLASLERAEANKGNQVKIDSISGITVSRSNKLVAYDGTEKNYGEEHDILKIKIKGIDPKAKWNFGFTVAPMHYYSDKAHTDAAMKDYTDGKVYDGTATNFGVSRDDRPWLDAVVANGEKNGVPVGAGPYKASSYNRGEVKSGTFYYNYIAYFERNEYFNTMGANIENAKIKYVNYKVMADDKITSALATGEIDYGEPVATYDNLTDMQSRSDLGTITYRTGGYGYVGINPKYVPDIEVREAIMGAFDTDFIKEYYGNDLVDFIYRPISMTSWAYPTGTERVYGPYTPQKIKSLVESSGNWEMGSDGYYKNKSTGERLKLTFTIAGESTDHPSYRMFQDAASYLKDCGFDISVVTDLQALKKLTTGDLAVWSAAWSTSIDPDPYQIYSLNSNATSTTNWAKTDIMKEGYPGGRFETELTIAKEINELIEKGREQLAEIDRKNTYADCFDKIMELCVEFPLYQRNDLCVYNKNVIDKNTLRKGSFLTGPMDELWKVSYV